MIVTYIEYALENSPAARAGSVTVIEALPAQVAFQTHSAAFSKKPFSI
jgi:hypothetical protein